MASCKDCISFSRCKEMYEAFGVSIDLENSVVCKHFKNKADFVEVVRCKACKYYKVGNPNADYCYHERYEGLSQSASYKPDDFCSYGTPKERGEEK